MIGRQNRVSAFTLIELLLVMVILVILSSVVVLQVQNRTIQTRITASKTDIRMFETALDVFQIDCGRYPSNDEGLSGLISNPGITGWGGPYIKLLPSDPWGTPYIYKAPGVYFPDSFDLYSFGPDKQEGNDDIVNWKS